MSALPPVPREGRCVCGAALWYVRPDRIGAEGHFCCRRCGARYAETRHWSPHEVEK